MATVKQTTYAIDAAGKALGRVASEAAKALMGKTHASYTPHVRSQVRVEITNASKIHMSEKKRLQKVYTRYTGYPGGLRRESLGSLRGRSGASAAVRHAVKGMLPRNTMLVARLKNLTIKD
ncbi:MAG TPA: 50S ribosomal protein L13 [Candidatus Paceibacterota bacterium]